MLSVLIWFPCIAAIIIALLPQQVTGRKVRLAALFLSGAILVLTLAVGFQFDLGNNALQFQETRSWLTDLGLDYQLGVDGLSLPLIVLNSLLCWIAIYSSRVETKRPRLFYALILLINGGVAGAFLAQNLLLFFLFTRLS